VNLTTLPEAAAIIAAELSGGIPDAAGLTRVLVRLFAAALLGAVVGLQRGRRGKPAGLRTHVLVASGAALFAVIPSELGMSSDGLSRVIQGVATGIGFIGAGAVLKLGPKPKVRGLTTAAGIWMTAGVGIAAGLGLLAVALVAVVLTFVVLSVPEGEAARRTRRVERTTSGAAAAVDSRASESRELTVHRQVETLADGG
jgi:putative Mg2+ transporter-C (MgtC) family protein